VFQVSSFHTWKEKAKRINGLPCFQVFQVIFYARTHAHKEGCQEKCVRLICIGRFEAHWREFHFLTWNTWKYGRALMGKANFFQVSSMSEKNMETDHGHDD